jgi:hypothetical protein
MPPWLVVMCWSQQYDHAGTRNVRASATAGLTFRCVVWSERVRMDNDREATTPWEPDQDQTRLIRAGDGRNRA